VTLTHKTWEQVRQLNQGEGFALGAINGESLVKDPKHLLFVLSRYKFAAKMLRNCGSILEVGCGEGLGALMFLAETGARVTALDFDEAQVAYCREHILPHGRGRLEVGRKDMAAEGMAGAKFDGLVCIDVIEHLHPDDEAAFMQNCADSQDPGGIAIFGTPSLNANAYASARSQAGHINLFDPARFTATLERHYSKVLPFSMNDEMVHTGFANMAHYLMALCIR